MIYLKLFENFSKDYEFEKGKNRKEKNIDARMKKDGYVRVNKKAKTYTKLYTDENGGSEFYTDKSEPVDTYKLAKKIKKDSDKNN